MVASKPNEPPGTPAQFNASWPGRRPRVPLRVLFVKLMGVNFRGSIHRLAFASVFNCYSSGAWYYSNGQTWSDSLSWRKAPTRC
jgi:hypothetical protein